MWILLLKKCFTISHSVTEVNQAPAVLGKHSATAVTGMFLHFYPHPMYVKDLEVGFSFRLVAFNFTEEE